MTRRTNISTRFVIWTAIALVLTGCAGLPWEKTGGEDDSANYSAGTQALPPLTTKSFINISNDVEILGELQRIKAHDKNTFSAIAREYNLGYNELRIANPTVDPWLPGADTPVYLPTMFVIPDVERNGIVVNLPSMRLLHFKTGATPSTSKQSHLMIASYPIGIGREGWATPTGTFHITEKTKNPNWYPPASVRAEHLALGDPLPAVVPSGPDNPLGFYKMRLSQPDYLIHGTNKPSGVGMRVSHGCIRLYPENIEALFESVPPKTSVQIINEPVLAGWRGDELYLEVHPLLVEDDRDLAALAHAAIEKALAEKSTKPTFNRQLVDTVIAEKRGLPFPITGGSPDIETFLKTARPVVNLVPLQPAQQTASR